MAETDVEKETGFTPLEACLALTEELNASDFVALILRLSHCGACRFKDTKEIMRFIIAKMNVFTETEPQFKEYTQKVKSTLLAIGVEERVENE